MEEGTTQKMFTVKKWNAIAMWSWDVECENCAICRVKLVEACYTCQDVKKECVTVWGECNHSFHHCCMNQWIKTQEIKRCPMCQSAWSVQRIGK